MKELLSKLKNNTENLKLVFKPEFFRISNDSDKYKFQQLINTNVHVSDDLYNQLKELIRSRHPKKTFSEADYAREVDFHIKSVPLEEYGVWVFYPWNGHLVHILDENEFVELRTSRNKYKITDAEEQILSTKKVGVVGLSVGQSVTLALCMERGMGEIRIADFDTLELTNLNRIRAGVQNLGLFKTIIVAREVAEIDPYLKVIPFTDGLNDSNMDEFFTGGGKLDLVIDECDGLDIKIKLRHKAKSLQVPVLMEASDRGTLDVERFDLQPDRPILHGFIDHLDASKIGSLTNEEKIPFILPMLGLETISARLKASMVEIGQTIVTWPQLASAVALGGALCADVCRRVLLGQFSDSGRYFIDIEELVGDKPKKMDGVYDVISMEGSEIAENEMQHIVEELDSVPSATTADQLSEIVTAAILAPSAGNNQPWKWLSKNGNLFLFHNRKKSASWSDQDDFMTNIAFGTALENVRVAAAALGFEAQVHLFPTVDQNDLVASVRFEHLAGIVKTELAEYIPLRLTNRKHGNRMPLEDVAIDQIKQDFSRFEEVSLSITTNIQDIEAISEIVAVAESLRFLHPQAHHEFFEKELKWNDSGREIIREGLDIRTTEMELKDAVGLKVAKDPEVIALLNKWEMGTAFEKIARKQVNTSSAIGLITIPSFNDKQFIKGGMALENLWLNCTAHHIAVHPVSAPLFLHTKIMQSKDHGMNQRSISTLQNIYTHLIEIFPDLGARQGVFLFRLSNADQASARSLRLPIEQLYTAL